MPPKKSIIPPTPPDLQMRLRGSRAVNPGAPDMPKPKRSSEVVQAERSAKQKEKEAKSTSRDAAIARIAELENEMEQADNETDLVANHPPPTQKKKIVHAPAAIAEESESDADDSSQKAPATKGKKLVVASVTAREGKNKDGEFKQDKSKGKKKPGKPLFVKGPALDSRPVLPIGIIDKQVLNNGDTHLAPKEGDGNKKAKSKMGLREMVTVKRKLTETETSTFIGRDSDTQHPDPALKRKAVVPAILDSDNESDAPKPAKWSKAVHRNVSATSASSNSQATTHSAAVSTISYTTVPETPEENGGGVLWNQVSSAGLSDGDDTEERKAAISSDRKSVYRAAKVQSSIKITPVLVPELGLAPRGSRATRGQLKKKDITMSSLPPAYRQLFIDQYIPCIRDFTGTLPPWDHPGSLDICDMFHSVFQPESQLFGELLTIVSKLTDDRLSKWRTHFAQAAMTAVEKLFVDHGYHTPDQHATYAEWMLGEKYRFRPYYYAVCLPGQENEAQGLCESELVLTVFATHFSSISTIHPKDRSPGSPFGALILSLQAIERAFMCYATGTKQIPLNALGYFSKNNWGDRTEIQKGKELLIKRSSNYIKLIDKFSSKKWHIIIKGAEQLVKGPKPVARKNSDPIVPYSSDFDIIDGEYGMDKDDIDDDDA